MCWEATANINTTILTLLLIYLSLCCALFSPTFLSLMFALFCCIWFCRINIMFMFLSIYICVWERQRENRVEEEIDAIETNQSKGETPYSALFLSLLCFLSLPLLLLLLRVGLASLEDEYSCSTFVITNTNIICF